MQCKLAANGFIHLFVGRGFLTKKANFITLGIQCHPKIAMKIKYSPEELKLVCQRNKFFSSLKQSFIDALTFIQCIHEY